MAARTALLAVAVARVLDARPEPLALLRSVVRSPTAPRIPVPPGDAGDAQLAMGSDRPRGARLGDVTRASRRAVLAMPALAPAAAHAAFGASAAGILNPDPGPSKDLQQARFLESLRALEQDIDNLSSRYGGELAPGGPRKGVPALLLVPILQLRQRLGALGEDLRGATVDEARWRRVGATLAVSPFATLDLKRTFNAYSDNIYYSSGSAEANAYLLGGSTPSTSQTTQYLLRNEFLKHIAECREEIEYQLGLVPEKREAEVAQEYLGKALRDLDEYLSLAPREEVAAARGAVTEPPR